MKVTRYWQPLCLYGECHPSSVALGKQCPEANKQPLIPDCSASKQLTWKLLGILELIVEWLFWTNKHANKWLVTSSCHFNALKWQLEVTNHLLVCLIVQNNHPTFKQLRSPLRSETEESHSCRVKIYWVEDDFFLYSVIKHFNFMYLDYS